MYVYTVTMSIKYVDPLRLAIDSGAKQVLRIDTGG